MALAIATEDVLASKPRCTNVVASRGYDDVTGEYTDTGSITVYSEYDYLDASDAYKYKTDRQWERFDLDFDTGDPSTVVEYHLATQGALIYGLAPVNLDSFFGTEPDVPDAPT